MLIIITGTANRSMVNDTFVSPKFFINKPKTVTQTYGHTTTFHTLLSMHSYLHAVLWLNLAGRYNSLLEKDDTYPH